MVAKKVAQTKLKPVKRQKVEVRVIGYTTLVTHPWSEKAIQMMRDKHAGKKTKTREVRDPEAEGEEAKYLTPDGKPGICAIAFKNAIISAAHNDLGIPRTLVCKSLFIYPPGRHSVIPLETASGKGEVKYEIVEDLVRVGNGAADLRYRPYYEDWAAKLMFEIDGDLLQLDDLLTLIDRAGFGVGVCEMRPECKKDYGRFRIDPDFKVKVTNL